MVDEEVHLLKRDLPMALQANDPEQAHEALLCGKSVVVVLEDLYLQEQCQQWLHLAKYCNATTIAFHSTMTPVPEILQEFR